MRSAPENPPMRPWHAGLTALQSMAPASQNYLLLDLSTVLTVRSCELWLLTIGAVFGEANETGHPDVNRAHAAACMRAWVMHASELTESQKHPANKLLQEVPRL